MESRVVDSRLAAGGTVVWRRRECDACQRRFTTYERVEHALPAVVKRDGHRVPFDREKIVRSLRIACNKRPVSADAMEEAAEVDDKKQSRRPKLFEADG
jgi:transcriptional repressor NrdR